MSDPAKILLIAEAANPEWVSVPLIGWSLARALGRLTAVHLVTQVRNRDALLRAGFREGSDFTAIDSEAIAAPIYRIGTLLRGGEGLGWTTLTAVGALSYYYFESLVWKRFKAALRRGEFSLVHRITPLSPTTPSILAGRCARASIPFVVGPLNGGAPWPREFDAERRKEREWLTYARGAYKLLPGYRSTLADSAAIIAGSRHTLIEIPERFRSKCVYIPENAVDLARFPGAEAKPDSDVLRACFVGRFVPYKGPDILLEAVAPLVKENRLRVELIGDGPLMPSLRQFVDQHDLRDGVALPGWIAHEELHRAMHRSRLFLFPSIREFGGGAILEAMALGIVPVVVDYAGPGELVTEAAGYKIPLGSRAEIVKRLRRLVADICARPEQLSAKSQVARARVHELFTWEAKARQILDVYAWIKGDRPHKPSFFPSLDPG